MLRVIVTFNRLHVITGINCNVDFRKESVWKLYRRHVRRFKSLNNCWCMDATCRAHNVLFSLFKWAYINKDNECETCSWRIYKKPSCFAIPVKTQRYLPKMHASKPLANHKRTINNPPFFAGKNVVAWPLYIGNLKCRSNQFDIAQQSTLLGQLKCAQSA